MSLALTGPMAYCHFELERGTHAFVGRKPEHYCLVEASDLAIEEYVPPAGIERPGAICSRDIRRSYDLRDKMWADKVSGGGPWAGSDFAGTVSWAMRCNLRDRLLGILRAP